MTWSDTIARVDIRTCLGNLGISYTETGKNVSTSWIGVCCPFCDDHSNHMGIHVDAKTVSCWRCGAKGTIILYLSKVLNKTSGEVFSILESFQDPTIRHRRHPIGDFASKLSLPESFTKDFPSPHLDYLKDRGFSNPKAIIDKYDLYASYLSAAFPYRIIIPIYLHRRMVSFVGRDITGQAELRYMNARNSESLVPVKDCLYNLDSVQDTVVIVEGPFDVWKLGGDGVVCTFGTKWTKAQASLLTHLPLRAAYVLFDNEDNAQLQADRLAWLLSGFIDRVEIYRLDKKDPGELTEEEVTMLRQDFFR